MVVYCVRSIMLRRMMSFASGETSYFSRITEGSRIRLLRNSGSLAALSRISLMISASLSRGSK